MAFPVSTTWTLLDFSGPTLGSLLSSNPSDLAVIPDPTYFAYNADFTVLTARSANGVDARLEFNTSIPSRFTLEVVVRFPEMPHNLGDLATRRVGFVLADNGGRGLAVYFAKSGVAISRVDDFGSVTALPDTSDTTAEVSTDFVTIRVAVDSGTGRAYVFMGPESGITADAKFILPVAETPPTVLDVFKFFAKGLASQPSSIEFKAIRLAGDFVIPAFPPVADAGADRVAPVGAAVRFDGRASYDVAGGSLSYAWTAVDAPVGSGFAADGISGHTVDNGDADGSTPVFSFDANSLPAWAAPGDVLRVSGMALIIATVNNSGGVLTVTQDAIPDNLLNAPFRIIDQSVVIGADTATPYVLPDVAGIYRLVLVVNDGISYSEPAEALANVVAARMPFGIEPDVSPIWRGLGDDWALVENRGVFEEAWRGAAQILSGRLLEAWQYHYNYSIRDAQRVFQKKWVALRSLIADSDPLGAVISARHGVLLATQAFEAVAPSVIGQTVVIEYPTSPTAVHVVTATLTGNTLTQIIADLNSALVGTSISAYGFGRRVFGTTYSGSVSGASTTDDGDHNGVTSLLSFPALSLPSWAAAGDTISIEGDHYAVAAVNNAGGNLTVVGQVLSDHLVAADFVIWRRCRLGLKANKAFRVLSSSTANLGFTPDSFNTLQGFNGALITNRTYYAGDGVDLREAGVASNDLLVTNGGQSFLVDRVLDGNDPLPGQRLLLRDVLPVDISVEWTIPSVVRSTTTDWEFEGSYPGDLSKTEIHDTTTGTTSDAGATVVAQKSTQLAVDLSAALYGALSDTARYEIRFVGVKRRKALPLPPDILSIPRLQDIIPVSQNPTIWSENVDYILEPFYRDIGGAPLPRLQFRDTAFILPDTEPPDIFWAELVYFDNAPNVEDLFGRLVGFLRDDASAFDKDFNYVAGVAGLLYAQQRGPSVHAVKVGAQILFGQPFAEVTGKIEEVRWDFSPMRGRLVIRDYIDAAMVSETVRTYYYKKDPLDLSASSGLATNPDTLAPWALGDIIPQFSPIATGVEVKDLYNDPTWYVPFVRSGLMTEIEKFHSFVVSFNTDLVTLADLALLYAFVFKVKPKHTVPILLGLRNASDELDVIDHLDAAATLNIVDSLCDYKAFTYDNYDGHGVTKSMFDDGTTRFDGIVDCPLDTIGFVIIIDWLGGPITYDSGFFMDTPVLDVTGNHTGTPGTTFSPTYDMTLEAGTYQVTVTIKGGGVVYP